MIVPSQPIAVRRSTCPSCIMTILRGEASASAPVPPPEIDKFDLRADPHDRAARKGRSLHLISHFPCQFTIYNRVS